MRRGLGGQELVAAVLGCLTVSLLCNKSSAQTLNINMRLTRHKLVSDAEFEEGLDIIDCLYTV